MWIASRTKSASARGFTLVELMVVVVIIAVLATLAVYGVSKYIASSKTGEAVQMIGSIKAAEESFRDETFQYLDVSGDFGDDNFYPVNEHPGQQKVQWGGGDDEDPVASNWRILGVTPSAPVLFVYAVVAGPGTVTPVSPGAGISVGNWPDAAKGEPWYVVKAKADLDPGGAESVYVAPSFTTQLFSANEGE